MRQKISQSKTVIIERTIILFLVCITVLLAILLYKQNTSFFNYNVSNFEDTKFVSIEPHQKDEDWFLYLWLTEDNKIKEVEYKIGEYSLAGSAHNDDSLFSSIDFPYYNETSYLMPYKNGKLPERNLKDILVYKEFTFQSGKTVVFVLDKEGNATILDE